MARKIIKKLIELNIVKVIKSNAGLRVKYLEISTQISINIYDMQ